jgi:cytochrome c oxidase cbb3-type subunit IV
MDFDLNSLRAGVTVLSFFAFIGIVVWAWSRRNQSAFDEAAQLPFVGDGPQPHSPASLEH